jgi:hypothetical protein
MKNRRIALTALMLVVLVVSAITLTAVGLLRPGIALAQGTPANPILVLVNSSSPNPFGRYAGEILLAEGFNEFQIEELADVDAAYLNNFDIVILTETPLSGAEVTMLESYVSGGGNLIAFRPDKQLAALFGLADAGGTTSEGYLLVSTSTAIGQGIVAETMQFHGEADHYSLAGASVIATLYSNATTPTSYPAIVGYYYGSGHTVAFTYDLAKSIVLMRQGNPDWAWQERDGVNGIRALDMFVGQGGEPNWIDSSKVHIPQADEQMRVLSHAIEWLNADRRPLPRLWYFPDRGKGMLIMTGDSEGCGTACVNAPMQHVRSYGGYYTAYLLGTQPDPTAVADWVADGHEIAVHYNDTGEASSPTWAGMWAVYDAMTQAHINAYGIAPRTVRNHWILWVGWSEQAEIEVAHGIQLDTNYYHYGSWAGGPGHFTGSGLPMKFSDENGQVLDIYQANTQLPDEWWGGGIDNTFQTLIDRSIDQEAYAFLTANFHPPSYGGYQADAGNAMAYANSRGVPIWSAEMLLDFLLMRDGASFENITWADDQLSFRLNAPDPGEGLTVMVPNEYQGASLTGITKDGASESYTVETIKGREYALVTTASGVYDFLASYETGCTPTPTPTPPPPGLTDTTVEDFACGEFLDTVASNMAGGEIRLAATLEDYFDDPALDETKWDAGTWTTPPGPYTPSIADGMITLQGGTNGAWVSSVDSFNQVAVEGRVRFTGDRYQHFGLANDLNAPAWWALFSTHNTGTGVYARTRIEGGSPVQIDTLLPGVTLNEFHDFKIVWKANSVEFYVDDMDVPVATHENRAITQDMKVWLSMWQSGSLSAEWIRVAEYPLSGTFTSCVLDAGETVDWEEINWTGDTPTGTSVSFETRSGDTATPDVSWSDWAPVSSAIASPDSRYIQYRIDLSTTDSQTSPAVEDVTITYSPTGAPTPTPTPTPPPGLTDTTVEDFACGEFADTVVSNMTGGEIRLAAALEDYFDDPALDDTKWDAGTWTTPPGPYTPSIADVDELPRQLYPGDRGGASAVYQQPMGSLRPGRRPPRPRLVGTVQHLQHWHRCLCPDADPGHTSGDQHAPARGDPERVPRLQDRLEGGQCRILRGRHGRAGSHP